jgi:hypothetical protein
VTAVAYSRRCLRRNASAAAASSRRAVATSSGPTTRHGKPVKQVAWERERTVPEVLAVRVLMPRSHVVVNLASNPNRVVMDAGRVPCDALQPRQLRILEVAEQESVPFLGRHGEKHLHAWDPSRR